MRSIKAWTLAAAAAILASAEAEAGGFRSLGKQLSKAAERAGVRSVAVIAFEPADSSPAREGWNIAERLTTQIVKRNRVQAVERNLLKKLMQELSLGETGILELGRLRRAGRVLAVDALVTGSFLTLGNEAVVSARLIHAETGAILAAAEERVEREWHDPLGLKDRLAEIPLDPFAFGGPDGEGPLIPPPALSSMRALASDPLRDALAQESCDGAAETVDRLESAVLDLKARYWAGRLKDGLDLRTVRHNPGSTITDPLLKREFYDRLSHWHARAQVPPLTPEEVKRFTDFDQKAFQLHRECGL